MCRDHPFSLRNKTTKRTVGVEVGGDGEGGWGWTEFDTGRIDNVGVSS